VETTRLLIAAAAEVDVVCKQICHELNPQSSDRNIGEYWTGIMKECRKEDKDRRYLQIPHFEVHIPRYKLQFTPWAGWTRDNPPIWWTASNKTKHQRHTHAHCASLENVLHAVAGLYVVCLYLYKDDATAGDLVPTPHVLRPAPDRLGGVNQSGYEVAISYKLGEC
jgi:hypothetical protein